MPNSEPVVSVRQVHKTYRRGNHPVEVLRGIDLQIDSGEFVSLMGPSGSGKTTLLNLIAGLDRPTSGELWCAGQKVSAMSESALTRWRSMHVGFIFQTHHLLPVLTAYENIELPLLHYRMSSRRRREQIRNVLNLVGLTHRSEHRPAQLSGGEQQRVGIARALAGDPDLIVADEPTGDLDERTSTEVLEVFTTVRDCFSKTILLVTHDADAGALAERQIRLENGKLAGQGAQDLTESR